MVEINPQRITGNWTRGTALDFHTTRSVPIGYNEQGHMQFDTTRPEIAELLYQLKYRGDIKAADGIIEAAGEYLKQRRHRFDIIVPVPPSTVRAVQPVLVLAQGIGQVVGAPVLNCITFTREPTPLKGVTDPDKRRELLAGLYGVDRRYTAGKNVLLFDDLFRSGATMNEIADVLTRQGRASSVRVLTVTKSRSHQ